MTVGLVSFLSCKTTIVQADCLVQSDLFGTPDHRFFVLLGFSLRPPPLFAGFFVYPRNRPRCIPPLLHLEVLHVTLNTFFSQLKVFMYYLNFFLGP